MTFTRWHISVVIGCAMIMIGAAVALTGIGFFNNPVTTELGFSVSSFTIYYTLFGLFTAAAMPVAGRLIGRLGGRMLLLVGGLVAGGGMLILSFASSLPLFYVGGTVLGIGFGLSIQFVPIVLVNRWFVARKGVVMGAVLAGSGVGGMILAFLIPQLIDACGWRVAYQVCAAVIVFCTAFPAFVLIRNTPEDAGVHALGAGEVPAAGPTGAADLPGLTLAEAIRTPWMILLYGSILLLGAMHAMGQHIANYMAGVPKDFSTAEISAAVMVISMSLVIFKPLLGALIDRLGLMRAATLTLSVSALVTFGSAFVTDVTLYVVAMAGLALGFANGTVTPPLVGARTFGQKEFPKIWGVLGTAYPIGSAVGAPLWGLTKDVFGSYGWGFVSLPVWTALVLAGFAISVRHPAGLRDRRDREGERRHLRDRVHRPRCHPRDLRAGALPPEGAGSREGSRRVIDPREAAALEFAANVGSCLPANASAAADVVDLTLQITERAGLAGVSVDVTYTEVGVSYRPLGEIPYFLSVAARSRSFNYGRQTRLRRLADDVIAGRLSIEDARPLLGRINADPGPYPDWVTTLFTGFSGAAAAVLFGGTWLVAVVAFAATLLLTWIMGALGRRGWPVFFLQILAGFTGAVVDAIMGWSLTVLGRLTEAVVNTIGLVIGIRAGMLISDRLGYPMEITTDVVLGYFSHPVMLLACAFVAVAFSIVAQSEARVFVPAALTAAGAWACYSVSLGSLGLAPEWAAGVAALFSGLVGTVFSRVQRVSIDSFAVTAILPFVPGLAIFKGLWALDDSLSAALPFLFTAGVTAIALAIGLTFGQYVSSRFITSARHARDHLLPIFAWPFSKRSSALSAD